MVPDDAEVERDIRNGDRDRGGKHALPDAARREQESDHDRDQEVREGEERVHDEHQETIERAAEVARDETQGDADAHRHHEGDRDDRQLRLSPPDHARHHVGGQHGRPHPVRRRGVGELGEADAVRLVLVEAVRRDVRRECGQHDEKERDRHADPEHRAGRTGRLPNRLRRLPQSDQAGAAVRGASGA